MYIFATPSASALSKISIKFYLMHTKDKILKTSLDLFNKNGIDKVSIREIAREMNISDGNLRYHFPKQNAKNAIIYRLYEKMMEEMEKVMSPPPGVQITIHYELVKMRERFQIQNKYKFFFLNLVDICRDIEPIRQNFLQRTLTFQMNFKLSSDSLFEGGYLKIDNYEELEEKGMHYFSIFNMLCNFWATDANMRGDLVSEDVVEYYFRISCSLIKPLLSEKGLEEYFAFFEEDDRLKQEAVGKNQEGHF